MQDQINQLNERGIKSMFFESYRGKNDIYRQLENARNGNFKILYCSPERLDDKEFRKSKTAMLSGNKISSKNVKNLFNGLGDKQDSGFVINALPKKYGYSSPKKKSLDMSSVVKVLPHSSPKSPTKSPNQRHVAMNGQPRKLWLEA